MHTNPSLRSQNLAASLPSASNEASLPAQQPESAAHVSAQPLGLESAQEPAALQQPDGAESQSAPFPDNGQAMNSDSKMDVAAQLGAKAEDQKEAEISAQALEDARDRGKASSQAQLELMSREGLATGQETSGQKLSDASPQPGKSILATALHQLASAGKAPQEASTPQGTEPQEPDSK